MQHNLRPYIVPACNARKAGQAEPQKRDSPATTTRPPVVYHSTGTQTLPPRDADDFKIIFGRNPDQHDLQRNMGLAGMGRFPKSPITNPHDLHYGRPLEATEPQTSNSYTDSAFQTVTPAIRKMALTKAKVKASVTAKKYSKIAAQEGLRIWAESKDEKTIHSEKHSFKIKLDDEGNADTANLDGRYLPNIYGEVVEVEVLATSNDTASSKYQQHIAVYEPSTRGSLPREASESIKTSDNSGRLSPAHPSDTEQFVVKPSIAEDTSPKRKRLDADMSEDSERSSRRLRTSFEQDPDSTAWVGRRDSGLDEGEGEQQNDRRIQQPLSPPLSDSSPIRHVARELDNGMSNKATPSAATALNESHATRSANDDATANELSDVAAKLTGSERSSTAIPRETSRQNRNKGSVDINANDLRRPRNTRVQQAMADGIVPKKQPRNKKRKADDDAIEVSNRSTEENSEKSASANAKDAYNVKLAEKTAEMHPRKRHRSQALKEAITKHTSLIESEPEPTNHGSTSRPRTTEIPRFVPRGRKEQEERMKTQEAEKLEAEKQLEENQRAKNKEAGTRKAKEQMVEDMDMKKQETKEQPSLTNDREQEHRQRKTPAAETVTEVAQGKRKREEDESNLQFRETNGIKRKKQVVADAHTGDSREQVHLQRDIRSNLAQIANFKSQEERRCKPEKAGSQEPGVHEPKRRRYAETEPRTQTGLEEEPLQPPAHKADETTKTHAQSKRKRGHEETDLQQQDTGSLKQQKRAVEQSVKINHGEQPHDPKNNIATETSQHQGREKRKHGENRSDSQQDETKRQKRHKKEPEKEEIKSRRAPLPEMKRYVPKHLRH